MATLRVRKSKAESPDPKPIKRRSAEWLSQALAELDMDFVPDAEIRGVTKIQVMRGLVVTAGIPLQEANEIYNKDFLGKNAVVKEEMLTYYTHGCM